MKLVFDIETNDLDFDDGNWLPQVHTVHCLVIQNVETGQLESFYDTEGVRELGTGRILEGIQKLRSADELVGHNIIQFDLPVLRKLYGFEFSGRVFDTLVASRTLYPDRVGGHSLEVWGSRLHYPKGDSPSFTEFSIEMLRYCEQDVRLNTKVYESLRKEASKDWDKALTLEHKIAEIIVEQERVGFHFNREQAEAYVHAWEEEIHTLDDGVRGQVPMSVVQGPEVVKPFKINGQPAKRTTEVAEKYSIDPTTIGGPFSTFTYRPIDLESKVKQKDLLLELGWKPKAHTKTGSPKLTDDIKAVGPVGEALAWRNVLAHRRSQVAGLLAIVDDKSRIHGGANPCGTNTSRMKHKRIVNIPRVGSPLGKEIRSLFCVPTGRVLVGYDAKALELRMLAHYIGNEEYNERVTTTNKSRDAHVLAAAAGGSDNRDLGKTINYALIYGAGDKKLGAIIGGSEADGLRLRTTLYASIPGLEDLVSRAKAASKRGHLIGLDGRKLYLRERVSPLNTLIQGGGSIFMKTAAVHLDRLVRDRPYVDAFKVIDMHDEAQWECEDEIFNIKVLEDLINQAFVYACDDLKLRCPQEPDVKVGKNWSETH